MDDKKFIPVNHKYVEKIVHQQQPNDTTCAHTCLSMVTGVPVQDIIDEFGDDYGLGNATEFGFLLRHGYWPVEIHNDPVIGWRFPRIGRYFMTVQSKNSLGSAHRILVEVDKDYNEKVYDPNEGRPGKKFYKDIDGMINFRVMEIFLLEKCGYLLRGLYREDKNASGNNQGTGGLRNRLRRLPARHRTGAGVPRTRL